MWMRLRRYSVKTKKLYGIDLDGVCFDFVSSFCAWLKENANVEVPANEEITSYYWYECINGLDKKTFWNEFHRFGEYGHGYKHLEPIEGARDALHKIIETGHDIIYVTNRPTYSKQDTLDSLRMHEFPVRELIFTEGKKHPIMIERGVDTIIDDSPRVIKELLRFTDVDVYVYNQPFNQNIDGEFTRVSSWAEFLEAEGIV